MPEFAVSYFPDRRQEIAASWPNSLDDFAAQRDWGWRANHDVTGLVEHVFEGLKQPA
jgi:hypothetical protein